MMSTKSLHRRAERSAIAGAVGWLVLLFFPVADAATALIARLLLIGVLVIIPLGLSLVDNAEGGRRLGLSLVDNAEGGRRLDLLLRVAVYAQPAGALLVIISFLLPQGLIAALLACGWLVVTGVISIFGIARLLSIKGMPVEEFSINAGLSYLSVGGGWLVFSRFGLQPLGFGDAIVLLTAVHFHFAGFAAPLLAGFAGRTLEQSKPPVKRLFQLTVACIVAGTPLVAAGITFSPALALAGAICVSAGLLLLALMALFLIVPRLKRQAAQALLIVSSISSIFAMTLACLYAYSVVTKTLIFNIPQMARLHGIANAIGFSLCGLLAWKLSSKTINEKKS